MATVRGRDLATGVMLASSLACASEPPPPRAVTVTLPAPAPSPSEEAVQEGSAPNEAHVASCFAEPVRMAEERLAAKTLTDGQHERLNTLLSGVDGQCMSVNPEAPPRFRGPFAIPTPECKYEIARIHFEAQHWIDAARWFRRLTFEHPDSDSAIYAAQLYLESLNVLGTHTDPRRPSCYEVMRADIDPIACMFCHVKENEEQCRVLQRIRFDLQHFDAAKPQNAPSPAPCPEGQGRTPTGCQPLPPIVPANCR
jgi:hypothetical protein